MEIADLKYQAKVLKFVLIQCGYYLLVGRLVLGINVHNSFHFENIYSTYQLTDITLITAIGVPMVENISTFIVDQKLCSYVPSFVNVLFILKIDLFHFQNFVS